MERHTAEYQASGYAWGREDASGVRTLNELSDQTPSYAFGVAYGQGWDDYNAGGRGHMIPVRDAYENWQASGGVSIFKAGDSTAECTARSAQWRKDAAAGVDVTSAQYLQYHLRRGAAS